MSEALSINLSDPNVRQALGMGDAARGQRKAVVQIAGDAPDPTGQTAGGGILQNVHLTMGKQEVVVVYRDMFLTVDVYAIPGEPIKIHVICPRCHKASQICGTNKKIEFEPSSLNPMMPRILETQDRELVRVGSHGRLSVETFECTWELGGDKHVAGAVHTGASLCRMRAAIENNKMVPA